MGEANKWMEDCKKRMERMDTVIKCKAATAKADESGEVWKKL